MTVFKGGSVNRINPLLNKWSIHEAVTANRLQPIRQLKQSVGVGHPFVTNRITKGTQSAAQNTVKQQWGDCPPSVKPYTDCIDVNGNDGLSICGGPCYNLG